MATVATIGILSGCSGGNIGSPISSSVAASQSSGSLALSVSQLEPGAYTLAGVRPLADSFGPTHGYVDSAATVQTTQTIAVSNVIGNVVNIYNPSGKQVAQLRGFSGPQGLASDIKGDLYVADQGNNEVQVFSAGFKGASTKLSDPGQYLAGVDSFSNGAFVAVTNLATRSGGAGSVAIFKGSKLIHMVTSSDLKQASFCAFDATGNLYVSGLDGSGISSVGVIANATTGGATYRELKISNHIVYPGGIQITTSGQIAVDDQSFGGSGSIIYTYNPPKRGSLGAPVQTTALTGSLDVITFAFAKNMNDLYVADAGSHTADEYAYPGSGSPTLTISTPTGVPVGIAVIPTQYPATGN